MTLLELMVAITIGGLVSLAALFAMRIGLRAWEKGQGAALQLRRVTNVEDMLHWQISNQVPRFVTVKVSDRRLQLPFFFAEENRLVFLSSILALQRGRGGIVVADYFAEAQPDRSWKLWLAEQPALDDESLAQWVEGIEPFESSQKPVLARFPTQQALLLWQGLSECRFEYRRESPPPAEWVPAWSVLTRLDMPSAIALRLQVPEAEWKGLAPASLVVPLAINGVIR